MILPAYRGELQISMQRPATSVDDDVKSNYSEQSSSEAASESNEIATCAAVSECPFGITRALNLGCNRGTGMKVMGHVIALSPVGSD